MGKLMSAEEVRAWSRERLAQMKRCGITHVTVLGCNYAPEECESYRAVKDMKFEIDFAPELPLPGCDQEFCRCVLLAAEA